MPSSLLSLLPFRRSVQWFSRPGFIKMKHTIELFRNPREEVMAPTFCFGQVNDTNGPLQHLVGNQPPFVNIHCDVRATRMACKLEGFWLSVPPRFTFDPGLEEKAGNLHSMEECFIAAFHPRTHLLPFSRRAPVGCRSDRAVKGGEADQCRLALMPFPYELSDVPFASHAHARGPRISQVRVMRPDYGLRVLTLLFQMLH